MSKIPVVLALIICIVSSPPSPSAAEHRPQLSGFVAVEGRYFNNDAMLQGQKGGPQWSLVAQPELSLNAADGRHQFKLTPFYRYDEMDAERTHFDLREAYWRYRKDDWELLIGANKVFWGVTESHHLVDIINQTDLLEDIDEENKLGQPMVMAGYQQDYGDFQLYLMPYFRERAYPGRQGRLRFILPVSEQSDYESGDEERHIDVALRYSHYFGDWDVGAYYFNGTGREPLLLPDATGRMLIPRYSTIQQVGTDLQYTKGSWLWKFEGIVRQGQGDNFGAVVGGVEYTQYQHLGTAADIGLLLEYNYDGRQEGKAPFTIYENDLFIGTRLTLNDVQNTTAVAGALFDLNTSATFLRAELERRIGRSFILEVQGRMFLRIECEDPVRSIKDDDFLSVSLQYHY